MFKKLNLSSKKNFNDEKIVRKARKLKNERLKIKVKLL